MTAPLDFARFGGTPTDMESHETLDFAQLGYVDPAKVCWNFGVVTPQMMGREPAIKAAHAASLAGHARFAIAGKSPRPAGLNDGESACLFELWKHPSTVAALGFAFPGSHQFTGSCVGSGYGNAVMTLSMADALLRKEPEEIKMLFWYYTYGRGRTRGGMNGRGEGSFGSAQAEAARLDGILRADWKGLPSYTKDDGICYGSSVEMTWSDGKHAERSMPDVPPEAKLHLVKTTAPVKTADEGEQALINLYPLTWCGNWGGLMQCEVKEGHLMNRRSGSWSHQQSCLGVKRHPKLGRIFWIQNQWGLTAHGSDPAGGPGGGYWVSEQEFEWQARNGEVFAFSGHDGYPAQQLDYFWCT